MCPAWASPPSTGPPSAPSPSRRTGPPARRARVVMPSSSGTAAGKLTGDARLRAGVLGGQLGLTRFVVSDSGAMDQVDPGYATAVAASVPAGGDMAMAPDDAREFGDAVRAGLAAGTISQARLDDAGRRIRAAIGPRPAPPRSARSLARGTPCTTRLNGALAARSGRGADRPCAGRPSPAPRPHEPCSRAARLCRECTVEPLGGGRREDGPVARTARREDGPVARRARREDGPVARTARWREGRGGAKGPARRARRRERNRWRRADPAAAGEGTWQALDLRDDPERHAEPGAAVGRRHDHALAHRRRSAEPLHPLVLEVLEVDGVPQGPVGPHDPVEG
jgi:hypothetical protein